MAKQKKQDPRNSPVEKADPPDSPITVGGGGGRKTKRTVDPPIYIHFDGDDYPSARGEYGSEILALDYVTLNGRRVGQVDETTKVEIKYQKTFVHNITVNKDGRMGVKFSGRHFRLDHATERHNGRGQVKSFKVGLEKIPLPNADEFVIMCHTKLKKPNRTNIRQKR